MILTPNKKQWQLTYMNEILPLNHADCLYCGQYCWFTDFGNGECTFCDRGNFPDQTKKLPKEPKI